MKPFEGKELDLLTHKILNAAFAVHLNVVRLKQGIVRMVHDFPDEPGTNLGGSRRTSAVK